MTNKQNFVYFVPGAVHIFVSNPYKPSNVNPLNAGLSGSQISSLLCTLPSKYTNHKGKAEHKWVCLDTQPKSLIKQANFVSI